MNDLSTLNVPATKPPQDALERLLDESSATFMGCHQIGPCHSIVDMRNAAAAAEIFLASARGHGERLRESSERLSDDEVARQVMVFVSAWPNASQGDLAGYGAQLLDDLLAEEPCRHALAETFRRLRRTMRFLPSIAEVLTELEARQARFRNTVFHIKRLPALVEGLTAMADRREQIDAERARRKGAAA